MTDIENLTNAVLRLDPEVLQRRFTAPKAGRYHVATGMWPHHVDDCTEACGGPPDATKPASSTYREIGPDIVQAMLSPGSYQLTGPDPAELQRLAPTLGAMNKGWHYATTADRPDAAAYNARLDELRALAQEGTTPNTSR